MRRAWGTRPSPRPARRPVRPWPAAPSRPSAACPPGWPSRAPRARGRRECRDARRGRAAAPDRFGDRPLQERRDDDVGLEQRHRLLRHRVVDIELDRDLVARALPAPRTAAGVRLLKLWARRRMRIGQQIRGSCSPASQSTMRLPPNSVCICTKACVVGDDLADDRARRAPSGWARIAASRRSASAAGADRDRACLRWRHRADRGRAARRPRAPRA